MLEASLELAWPYNSPIELPVGFLFCIIGLALKCKVKAIRRILEDFHAEVPTSAISGVKAEVMNGRYTISQLAHAADIPTTTVRYYERAGLVGPEERSAGNYRLYSDVSLRKVKFIRAAQAIGFTLDDVKALLAAPESSAASCQRVQPLIEARLADVARRLK
ncbi:MAG: MerR family transcriptional regulator, partial [Pirellulales bacterium]